MINLPGSDDCTGCGACAAVCPVRCISMEQDDEGFFRPRIDYDKCIECRQCEKSCHVLLPKKDMGKKPLAYAARSNDDKVLNASSSGGAFSVFAQQAFKQNGVIYGAEYQDDWTVSLTRAQNEEEIAKMRGSKYLQSTADKAYAAAKEDLDRGTFVVFTGLPCQVSGLYAFLKDDPDNLIIVDIICHGAASPGLFQEYIKYREDKTGKKIVYLNHRDKKVGWNEALPIQMMIETQDGGREYIPAYEDPYLYGFLQSLTIMRACSSCPYATVPRYSDISMGDFGGLGVLVPSTVYNSRGVSQILVNTEKGKRFFDSCGLLREEHSLRECMGFNLNIWKPAPQKPKRDAFFKDYKVMDFGQLKEKYLTLSAKMRMLRKMKRMTEKAMGAKRVTKMMFEQNKKAGALDGLNAVLQRVDSLPEV